MIKIFITILLFLLFALSIKEFVIIITDLVEKILKLKIYSFFNFLYTLH